VKHGEYKTYVHDRCRCVECTAAAARRERERYHRKEPAFVSAEPVREHLKILAKAGIGSANAAKLAGVSEGCVRNVLTGMKGNPPAKRISKANADKILALKASEGADLGRVSGVKTIHRVDMMLKAGFSLNEIGRRIGIGHFTRPGKSVSRKTERLVKQTYCEWRDSLKVEEKIRPGKGVDTSVFDSIADSVQVRERRTWQRFADCAKHPTYLWFIPESEKEAKKICENCGVREKCLLENLHVEFGVFGGLNASERLEYAESKGT